jgi:hypothetical protein
MSDSLQVVTDALPLLAEAAGLRRRVRAMRRTHPAAGYMARGTMASHLDAGEEQG